MLKRSRYEGDFKQNQKSSILARLAFTLAEILIVLGIVGIIAEMTIPTLYNRIMDLQYRSMFLRTYSDLQGVFNNVIFENGGSLVGIAVDYGILRQALSGYFLKIQECKYQENQGICWHQNGVVKLMNNTQTDWGADIQGWIVQNSVFVQTYFNTDYKCSVHIGNIDQCGWIRIDVNGFKGPNKYGKDIYMLHMLRDKIIPQGTEDSGVDTASTTCIPGGTGVGCAAYVINHIEY